MNRVVLCGRLAGRPKLAYTPAGIAVAEFRLLVPRTARLEPDDPPDEPVDCVAFRQFAEELVRWGDRDYRVNLDGHLRAEAYWAPEGRQLHGLRVHVEHGYLVDPVGPGPGTDLSRFPNVPLPVPAGPGSR
jgi:single-strand DNA-binding protein